MSWLVWGKLCGFGVGVTLCLPLGRLNPRVLVGRTLKSQSGSYRLLVMVQAEACLLPRVFEARIRFQRWLALMGWLGGLGLGSPSENPRLGSRLVPPEGGRRFLLHLVSRQERSVNELQRLPWWVVGLDDVSVCWMISFV